MHVRAKVSLTVAVLAVVGGMFATPAQGQTTLYSETYSASGGTATDNTYTLFAGSPPTVVGGRQDFSGGVSTNIQSPAGASPNYLGSDPVTVSFDFFYTGPLAMSGSFFTGLLDGMNSTTNFGVTFSLASASPILGVVVSESGSADTDLVSGAGLTAGTTYAVSATFTPGVGPGTTDVTYSILAVAGPGGDITTGTVATLTEAMSPGLATFANGGVSGEGNFFVDNLLITAAGAAPAPGMPVARHWGLTLTVLMLTFGGMFAVRRGRKLGSL